MNVSVLTRPVTVEGEGLHTGARGRITLLPASRGGICFLKGATRIPAVLENVVDTERGISLGKDGRIIRTVEHLLAALRLLGVQHLEINTGGEEVPILDGSSLGWLNRLEPHLERTDSLFPSGIVAAPVVVQEEGCSIRAVPGLELSVRYEIDFPNSPVGSQSWEGAVSPEVFAEEIAPARTFGFLDEVSDLRLKKLALGGNLENCVVISRDKFLTPLRFQDEMVRHKVLDLVGDLALLPWIPAARVEVFKGSHRLHVALARILESQWISK